MEVYQNCNVFNDGAFEAVTAKDNRASMLVPLEHGKAVRFGAEGGKRHRYRSPREPRIVDVADVGEENVLVHDESRSDPSLAFALSRLAAGPSSPTPIGVFRAVERPPLVGSGATRCGGRPQGHADLDALLRSGTTWTVE